MVHVNAGEGTILILEDEPDEAILLQQAFQKAGAKNPIRLFRDGQEVIDYLSRRSTDAAKAFTDGRPGLMLLDLKMPRKTGFEVLQWLRHQSQWKRLIVVVMANSLHPGDISRAYELGCNSYLEKAVNPGQFAEMVGLILRYWLVLNISPDLAFTANSMGTPVPGIALLKSAR